MAAHQRSAMLATCALLWLGLLLACGDVDGCTSNVIDKVKSAGKAVGTKLKLIKKKSGISDAAEDAASNAPKAAVADVGKVGSAAATESQKLSGKAKIAAMLSPKIAEDGTKHFSSTQKKAFGAAAAVGVGTAAAGVVASKAMGNKGNKDNKGSHKDATAEKSQSQQGATANAPAQPKAQRRTVSEKESEDGDENGA